MRTPATRPPAVTPLLLGMACAAVLAISGGAIAQAQPAAERVFDLRLDQGQLALPSRRLRVTQGDSVRLRWSTDARVVLHLHGYDIERTVTPGQVTEFRFKAHAAGRFPVNLHRPGGDRHEAPVTVLEVHPR
jgi:hypothetical protein